MKLSANRCDGETYRIERLCKVRLILSLSETVDVDNIVSLHDHKGDLTVCTRDAPSEHLVETCKMAWELMNELAMNVHVRQVGEEDCDDI